MKKCWEWDVADRPSFAQIKDLLETMYASVNKGSPTTTFPVLCKDTHPLNIHSFYPSQMCTRHLCAKAASGPRRARAVASLVVLVPLEVSCEVPHSTAFSLLSLVMRFIHLPFFFVDGFEWERFTLSPFSVLSFFFLCVGE